MKRHMFAIAGICILVSACGRSHDSLAQRAARDDVTEMSDDDPAMAKAFRQSRATLETFLSMAAKPPAGLEHFAVKVRIKSGDNTEYFWVDQFTPSGEVFRGIIQNDGELVRGIHAGQAYQFVKADIVDWMYIEPAAGKMHGNFTACALLTRESATEAAQFRKQYGLACES